MWRNRRRISGPSSTGVPCSGEHLALDRGLIAKKPNGQSTHGPLSGRNRYVLQPTTCSSSDRLATCQHHLSAPLLLSAFRGCIASTCRTPRQLFGRVTLFLFTHSQLKSPAPFNINHFDCCTLFKKALPCHSNKNQGEREARARRR